MNSTAKRKTRNSSIRFSRNQRNKPQERSFPVDGIYANSRFMNVVAGLLGCPVKVQTNSKELYEGIFNSYSERFDLSLDMVHIIDPNTPNLINKDKFYERMIFKPSSFVSMSYSDVDLEYGVRGMPNSYSELQNKNAIKSHSKQYATGETNFATDSAIASKSNGQSQEKELQPWEGPACDSDDDGKLQLGSANGWDADDMFKKNEEVYGVQSTFDTSLAGYTIPLEKKNTEEYKRNEAEARRIAKEIESDPGHKDAMELENGDEEDRFSAVIRSESAQTSNTKKYIPPARRKSSINGNMSRGNSSSSSSLNSQSIPANIPSPSAQSPQIAVNNLPQEIKDTKCNTDSKKVDVSKQDRINKTETKADKSLPEAKQPSSVVDTKLNEDSKKSSEAKPVTNDISCNSSGQTTANVKMPEKKTITTKTKEDQVSELKKFGKEFEMASVENPVKSTEVSNIKNEDLPKEPSNEVAPVVQKKSNLNPNAKSFIPKTNANNTPPRPHTPQTPQMTPQPQYMPVPLMGPYMVATTQAPYTPVPQPSRYRKLPMNNQRPDVPPHSMQVAAATGPPIMAPAAMPGASPSQFALPFATLPAAAPSYPQMYVKMVPQQAMPVVPTSLGYSAYTVPGDQQQQTIVTSSQQHHGPIYANPMGPNQAPPPHPGPAPSPAQSQNPQLHPTPSATPQPIMYPGTVLHQPQGPPQPNAHNPQSPATTYPTPPPAGSSYPVLFLSSQFPPGTPHVVSHNIPTSGAGMNVSHMYIHQQSKSALFTPDKQINYVRNFKM